MISADLRWGEVAVLGLFERQQVVDIRGVGEALRQRCIDLAMKEPPLIEIDADQMSLTAAGRHAVSLEDHLSGTNRSYEDMLP